MVSAAKWARESKTPMIGLCLGMQVIAIEFARNVLGAEDANSEEFNPLSQNLVVIFMPEHAKTMKGATMKLGSYTIEFPKEFRNSKMCRLYKANEISERFRHRYVIDPKLNSKLSKHGLKVLSTDKQRGYANILELDGKFLFRFSHVVQNELILANSPPPLERPSILRWHPVPSRVHN